jgi:hypothetical protein
LQQALVNEPGAPAIGRHTFIIVTSKMANATLKGVCIAV